MATPKRPLADSVPWPAVAAALDIPHAGASLPTVTVCPLCRRETLAVYDDPGGGHLFFCQGCQAAGTTIELAGRAWGCPPAQAALRLAAAGVPAVRAGYTAADVAQGLARGQAVRQLWQEASDRLAAGGPPEAAGLKQAFRLGVAMSPERWRDGPGRLVGCVDPVRAAGVVTPPSRKLALNAAWGELLVLPRHDVPGHLCGFEFIGRRGRGRDYARVLCPTRPGLAPAGRRRPVEIGLFGLEAACAVTPFRVPILAVADAALALRLQMRHFASAVSALPIVAWADDGRCQSGSAWAVLAGRQVVFWALPFDVALLCQAMRADGWITTAGPEELTPARLDHYVRLSASVLDLVGKLAAHARPWRRWLADWLAAAAEPEVGLLAHQLRRRGYDLTALAATLGCPRAAARLARLARLPGGLDRTVRLGRELVAERAGGWFHLDARTGQAQRICNAVIRIDRAFIRRDHHGRDRPRYQGRILYEQHIVPFDETAGLVRHRTAEFVDRTLIRAGVGLIDVRPGWGRRLYGLALAFQPPEIGPDAADAPGGEF